MDYTINERNSSFFRYTQFYTPSKFNTSGGMFVRSAGNNFDDRQGSGVAPLTSILSPTVVNEFRFGDLRREFFRPAVSGQLGPIIQITGVANLGSNGSANQRYFEDQVQFVENLSVRSGAHSFKFGFDINTIKIDQFDRLGLTLTFGGVTGASPLQQYLNTINNVMNPATGRPFTYTQLEQQFGDNTASHRTQSYNFFAQDDWRVRPNLTLSYGIRYEVLDYPSLNANAPLDGNRRIPSDNNNWAPRFGFAYQPTSKTVVRGGYGLFYDTLNLRLISAVIRGDGQRVQTFRVPGTAATAPAFPTGFSSPDPAFNVRPSATTFAQDFRTMYAHQGNFQVEQEISNNLSVTLGYIFYGNHRAPLLVDTNLGTPTSLLADGRPVFGGTRPDTRYNQILELRSVGNGNYHGGFVQISKRFNQGLLFQTSYTYSKGINDNDSASDSGTPVSDPTNISRDRGPSSADQRHCWVLQGVWQPTIRINTFATQS